MDRLTIMNRALLKTGLPPAAALEDINWNANMVFEDVAVELLRGFPWGFAQKYAVLPQSQKKPVFGWNYSYDLPEDCLRVIDVHACNDLRAPKARYVISGRQLLCNVTPCNMRYVGKVLDPSLWSNDFADAVAARIACEIAGLAAENMGLVPQLMQLFNIALSQAQLSDAREETERVPLPDSLFASRQMTQVNRD